MRSGKIQSNRVPRVKTVTGENVRRTCAKLPAAGRFGDEKCFIFSVWAHGQYDMSLEKFKTELLRLLREGEVVLARADLAPAMPSWLVKYSEIVSRGAEFHFVLRT